jgi:hypothetical protein
VKYLRQQKKKNLKIQNLSFVFCGILGHSNGILGYSSGIPGYSGGIHGYSRVFRGIIGYSGVFLGKCMDKYKETTRMTIYKTL